jgi:NTE family protein
MLQQNRLQWPSSAEFSDPVYGQLREDMCRRSLMWGAIRKLVWPWNWVYLLSRAELVAKALHGWGIKCSLAELPEVPEWSINGTTAENGRRFRFKRGSIGDWQLGYARPERFPLAKAMAVSAAFPGGIGPLSINAGDFSWKKRSKWDRNSPEADISLPFKRLRLYDGGVYDNLGLEPYFDTGERQSKVEDIAIYVSDAGAPLAQGPSAGPLSPWRVKRLADIMSEQSRTLRVRAFLRYLDSSKDPLGAYVYIASQAEGGDASAREIAKAFPTSLKRLSKTEFDAIAGHGYAVAKDVERVYGFIRRL